MIDGNQEMLTDKDRELFHEIAKDIYKNPDKYREAGEWLDEYCNEESYWQRQKNKLEELQSKKEKFSTLPIVQDVKKLKQEIEIKQTPALFVRFQEARDYLLEKYEDQQFIPEDDARKLILIVWLLTEPDAEKANVNITNLEKWTWEPVDNAIKMSRGYAAFLWCHGGRIDKPSMKLVRIAWAKLSAEEDQVTLLASEDEQSTITRSFIDNLLRATIKHIPFYGPFLYDVIYGTIDSQKSQKKTTGQRRLSRRHPISEKQETRIGGKKDDEVWYQSRTIQAALIGVAALLLVSIVGWFIILYINKSNVEQAQIANPSEDTLFSSLREICQDIDNRPLLQQEETAKRYTGIEIKREKLKLFDLHEYEDGSIYGLTCIFPDEMDVSYLTGRRIHLRVEKADYPQLNGAKRGIEFYVSGKIQEAGRTYVQVANATIEFE